MQFLPDGSVLRLKCLKTRKLKINSMRAPMCLNVWRQLMTETAAGRDRLSKTLQKLHALNV